MKGKLSPSPRLADAGNEERAWRHSLDFIDQEPVGLNESQSWSGSSRSIFNLRIIFRYELSAVGTITWHPNDSKLMRDKTGSGSQHSQPTLRCA